MGSLRDKPLDDLIRSLKEQYSITTLIETGTEHGISAIAASEIFDHVVTIENDDGLSVKAIENSRRWPRNVEFIHGDSRQELPGLVACLNGTQALFWLDAHTIDGCPLIGELNAIGGGHVILIDDARQVHWWYHWRSEPRISWPSVPIIEEWAATHDYALMVHEHDVFVLTPKAAG